MRIDVTTIYCVMFLALAFFTVIFGRRMLFGDERMLFSGVVMNYGIDLRARVAAAIERREGQQHPNKRIAWLLALILAIISVLGFVKILNVAVMAALGFSALAVAMALDVLGTSRNVAGLRAASLERRSTVSLVPLWYLLMPIPVWCLGLWLGVRQNQITVVALGILGAIAVYIMCFQAAQAPAIVDPNHSTDQIVDRKVRATRIRTMLYVSAMVPAVVAQATGLIRHQDDLLSSQLILLMVLSYSVMVFWSRTGLNFTPAEVAQIIDDNGAAA